MCRSTKASKSPPKPGSASPEERGSAQFLTSPLLEKNGFKHAFFTRDGGVSQGPYASLNFSYAVGDAPQNVDENIRRAAQALAVPSSQIFFLSQVHGNDVVELSGKETQRDILFTSGDALVSSSPLLACGVRTADCLPILIGDSSTGRVAAVHAGWRGLVARVIAAAVRSLGGSAGNWCAAIGPHISVDRFEVSEEVATQLESAAHGPCVRRQAGKKPYVNLRQVARGQLEGLGLRPDRIDDVAGCTQGDATHFFSFRRDGKHSGRHLSAILAKSSEHSP